MHFESHLWNGNNKCVGYYLSINFDNYNWDDVFFLLNFYLKFRSYLPPLSTTDVLDQLSRDRIIRDLSCICRFFHCRAFLSTSMRQSRGRRALLWRTSRFWQEETFLLLFFCIGGTGRRTSYGLLLTPASASPSVEYQQVFLPWELKHRNQYSSHLCLT